MTRLNRSMKRAAAAFVIVVMALAISSVLIFQSGWFQERLRERILRELENGTGGRVELGNFSFNWRTLEATVAPLILHGTESADEPPMVRIEKVTIGLRVISALERRVDLASVHLDRPSVYIAVYPDGTTNLPVPRAAQDKSSWAGHLVDLAVRRYEVVGGLVEYDNRLLPVDLRGEDLRLAMNYEAAAKRYRGDVASHHLHMGLSMATPVEFDAAANFTLERDRLTVTRLHVASGQSRADLTGALTGLRAPSGEFRVKALVAARDAAYTFSLPLQPTGSATAEGTLSVFFGETPTFTLDVGATARGLGYVRDRVNIKNASASARVIWNPEGVTLKGLTLQALGARFAGNAALNTNLKFHLDGNFEDVQLADAAGILTARTMPWSATLSGSLTLDTADGGTPVRLDATSMLVPVAGVPSLDGQVAFHYDQQAGTLRFDDSRLTTGSTTVDFSGVPGESLDVRARSGNLNDILPALALLDVKIPQPLPVQLNGGELSVSGTLSGTVDDPRFHGDASLTKAGVQGHPLDRFSAQVDASEREISLRAIDFSRGALQIKGEAAITAREGTGVARKRSFDDGAIAGRLDVRNASIPELLQEAGLAAEVRGTATAEVRVSGTVQNPEADATLDVLQAAAFGEQFERLRGNVHYTNGSVRFTNAEATLGPGRLAFDGSYQASGRDWTHGDLSLDLNARAIGIGRVSKLRALFPNIEGIVEGKFALRARVEPNTFLLRELNGEGTARRLTVYAESLGDITLAAETHGAELALHSTAKFRDAAVQGQGTWRLEGDYPGSATFRFSRLTVASLHGLVMIGATEKEKSAVPPFDGFVEGGVTLNVPLRRLDQFQAEVRMDTVQFMAAHPQAPRPELATEDIVLKNAQPVLISVSAQEARVRSALFTARDTNLEVSGAIPLRAPGGADLTVKGGINLAILQLLNPDLQARGSATVSTAIRGSVRNPQVNGRLELKSASLYLEGLANGVDNANGAILFDRNRATIESLVAETGGGRIILSGFLEFASPLIYRLQADVRQVRVRYPEDVSTTGTAQLSLYGTSEASTLSGTVTVTRAAISARADFGKMLAAGVRSSAAPAANDYLNGVRFDVRVQSAANLQLETSLTRDVQASIDLRLRGTPVRPVLLGEITVNSGEVQIFGNRYTVNRGEIRFLNPVKIEPTLDVNLETSTRGITVNVSLSGPPQKLNVNYSSDPPLQSREIIALLAVGRDPSTTRANDISTASSTAGFGDGGGILGQAVSEQLSNSLQRFFGASRVKIDPTMTGLDNLPEARLTFEQQVSRNVNLTYITNLNHTQEQIVRVQFDLSPRWSVIAVRDSNGLFGMDLQYRKRFK
jgi:translocation and assembly module TamB